MAISDSARQSLINILEKANSIHLVDDDLTVDFDDVGNPTRREAKEMARVKFGKSNELLSAEFEDFTAEYINNRYIVGFNTDFYLADLKTKCESILGKFEELSVNGIKISARTDTIYKHFVIGEEDTLLDEFGYQYNVQNPKIIKVDLATLGKDILDSISGYYNFQKKLLKKILKYIKDESNPKQQLGKYGSTYQHNYFKFDISRLGGDSVANEYIQDFFKELIDKKFVHIDSLKSMLDFFNDMASKKKVIWLRTKTELWYLIRQMVHKGFLVDPKREAARIIPKIFVSNDGKSFDSKDFKGLHTPQNTRELDDILAILG